MEVMEVVDLIVYIWISSACCSCLLFKLLFVNKLTVGDLFLFIVLGPIDFVILLIIAIMKFSKAGFWNNKLF